MKMDQIKTTKDHHNKGPPLSTIGELTRNDLLSFKVVTLDTSHLLRSALKLTARLKAVVFW